MELETDIKVLDHGYVRYQGHFGSEEDIIRAARMSTDKGFLGWSEPQSSVKGDENLLEYLYKNYHMTPFEMCELRFEVKAPIMVFREWHRHRTQSFNEMSGRYIQMPNEHYVPGVRMQDKKNKQSSEQYSVNDDSFTYFVEEQQKLVYNQYSIWVNEDVAKEVARINTPISRYSKMWVKTDLRNWLNFLNLRMRKNAQWEIRQYANAIAEMIKFIYPRTYALFEEYTLGAVSLSRSEAKLLLNYFTPYYENSEQPSGFLKMLDRIKEASIV